MSQLQPLAELREQWIDVLSGNRRHLDILSPALELPLLGDDALGETILRLARRGPQTRIRVLVAEVRGLLESGHPLLALVRRLPTAMTLQVLPEHPEWQGETLILADRWDGLWVNLAERRWQRLDTPGATRREAERFDRLWNASAPSLELRQF